MVITDMAASDVNRVKWPLITLGEQHSKFYHTRHIRAEYLLV